MTQDAVQQNKSRDDFISLYLDDFRMHKVFDFSPFIDNKSLTSHFNLLQPSSGQSSRTFHVAMFLFPPAVRRQIETLYRFMRACDDIVDEEFDVKIKEEKFSIFIELTYRYVLTDTAKKCSYEVIDNFSRLVREKHIPHYWVKEFLYAMSLDCSERTYATLDELLSEYILGSASVVGFMICRILGVEFDILGRIQATAQAMGEAFQLINFWRDLGRDLEIKRKYIPLDILAKYDITYEQLDRFALEYRYAALPELLLQKEHIFISSFVAMMREDLLRVFIQRLRTGESGYPYIDTAYLPAIVTAVDRYIWTAKKIYKDPLRVFRSEVKPYKAHTSVIALRNLIVVGIKRSVLKRWV